MLEKITRILSRRPLTTICLATIGGAWCTASLYSLAALINLHFVKRSRLQRYQQVSGKATSAAWAVVTGASDGIGRAFADELCNRGFNVVLHGRNEAKLESVKSDLLERWPDREIRLLVFDATRSISELEDHLRQLNDLNTRVLINNVGAAQRPFFVPLAQHSVEKVRVPIEVDALFTTEITRILLPQLIHRSPALIINIGSLGSEAPLPYASVLSGVKAYTKAWSRSLNDEMKAEGHDIEVMHVLVGTVATPNMGRTPSLMVPTPRQMASSTLNKVGCGHDVIVGYWAHALQYLALAGLPSCVCEPLICSVARGEKEKEERMLKGR